MQADETADGGAGTGNRLKRRGVLAGAGALGVAGAALLAAKALPPGATAPALATAATATLPSGGYQATAHVLRYYQTAKV